MRGLLHTLCGLLAVLCSAQPPGATEPSPGLMWQTTGLPAVFPLTVKTPGGADYYLTLNDPATGHPKLAAYLSGGVFFRVLVPPGTYAVHLASGRNWLGEDDLFGAATRHHLLLDVLTFEVSGISRKTGHVLDLTVLETQGRISHQPQTICQSWSVETFPRPLPPFDGEEDLAFRLTDPGALLRHPEAFFDPERSAAFDRPVIPTDHAPYLSDPTWALRQRICP